MTNSLHYDFIFNSGRLLLWTQAQGAGGQDYLFNPLDLRQFLKTLVFSSALLMSWAISITGIAKIRIQVYNLESTQNNMMYPKELEFQQLIWKI